MKKLLWFYLLLLYTLLYTNQITASNLDTTPHTPSEDLKVASSTPKIATATIQLPKINCQSVLESEASIVDTILQISHLENSWSCFFKLQNFTHHPDSFYSNESPDSFQFHLQQKGKQFIKQRLNQLITSFLSRQPYSVSVIESKYPDLKPFFFHSTQISSDDSYKNQQPSLFSDFSPHLEKHLVFMDYYSRVLINPYSNFLSLHDENPSFLANFSSKYQPQNTYTKNTVLRFPTFTMCQNTNANHQEISGETEFTEEEKEIKIQIQKLKQSIQSNSNLNLYSSIQKLYDIQVGRSTPLVYYSVHQMILSLPHDFELQHVSADFLSHLTKDQIQDIHQIIQEMKAYKFLHQFLINQKKCKPNTFQETIEIALISYRPDNSSQPNSQQTQSPLNRLNITNKDKKPYQINLHSSIRYKLAEYAISPSQLNTDPLLLTYDESFSQIDQGAKNDLLNEHDRSRRAINRLISTLLE